MIIHNRFSNWIFITPCRDPRLMLRLNWVAKIDFLLPKFPSPARSLSRASRNIANNGSLKVATWVADYKRLRIVLVI